MKKVSLFLSMIAFVSFVAIAPVSAQSAPKKANTAQPAAKKACCADPSSAKCAMAKDGKVCTADKAKKTAEVTKKK